MITVKLHLVFPETAGDVYEALQSMAEVTGWDYNLDTAAQWAASGQGETPDIFFINGTVGVSTIDTKTKKRMTKHQAMVNRLQTIRLARPSSRIILVLPLAAREKKQFVSDLIALGIYDIYFVSEFNEDDIRQWINNTKSIVDMQPFLPGGSNDGESSEYKSTVPEVVAFYGDSEEIDEEKYSLKKIIGSIKGIAKHLSTAAKKHDSGPNIEISDWWKKNTPKKQERCDFPGLAYCLGNVKADFPDSEYFTELEQIDESLKERVPDAVFIDSNIQNLEDSIRSLRSSFYLQFVPLVVVGPCDTARCYAAGADDCVITVDNEIAKKTWANAGRLRQIRNRAVKDDLTGLYKKQFLDNYLEEKWRQLKENGNVFSLAMLDLDYFKKVNDTHGHQAGDQVLSEFASFLTENLRDCDMIARYGGEEFTVVSPLPAEKLQDVLQRLGKLWSEKEIKLSEENSISTTFSGGVADALVFPSSRELIQAADRALYDAKEHGRNNVKLAAVKEQKTDVSIKTLPESKQDSSYQNYELSPYTAGRETAPQDSGLTRVRKGEKTRTAVIASIGIDTASAAFTVFLINYLAVTRKGRITAVDCDLRGKELGFRAGINPNTLTASDWRRTTVTVPLESGARLFPLDPALEEETSRQRLRQVINEAANGSNLLFLEAGQDYDSRWFAEAVDYADAVFWIFKEDPLLLERAGLNWKKRPRLSCREYAVICGGGKVREIEERFVIPCFSIRNGRRDDLKKLLKTIDHSVRQDKRIITVGFKKAPEITGALIDNFKTIAEARAWLDNNRADMVILSSRLKQGALLEYDLKNMGIPFRIEEEPTTPD